MSPSWSTLSVTGVQPPQDLQRNCKNVPKNCLPGNRRGGISPPAPITSIRSGLHSCTSGLRVACVNKLPQASLSLGLSEGPQDRK